jgi:hypothetical protein
MSADKALRLQIQLEAAPDAADKLAKTIEEGNRRAAQRAGSGLATTPDLSSASPEAAEKRLRALERISNARAKLAREARAQALAQLPLEEQLNRLLRQREQIEGRLVDAGGNKYRTQVLKLGGQRLDAAIGAVRGQISRIPAASDSTPAAEEPEQRRGIKDLLTGSGGYVLRRELLRSLGVSGVAGNLGSRALGGVINSSGPLGSLVGPIIAGAAAIGIVGFAMKRVAENAREISDAASKLNITPRDAQKLRFAAKAGGSNPAELYGALGQLQEAQIAAEGGDYEALRRLQRAGLNPRGDSTENLFQLGRNLESGKTTYATGKDLVGGEGVTALRRGASEAADRFDKLNVAISDDGIETVRKFSESLSEATTVAEAFAIKVLNGLERNTGSYLYRTAIRGGAATLGPAAILAAKLTSDGQEPLGPPLSLFEKAQKKLQELEEVRQRAGERLADENDEKARKAQFDLLDTQGKMAELLRRRNDGLELFRNPSLDPVAKQLARQQVIDSTEELRNLRPENSTAGRVSAGGLSNVGLFQGVAGSDLENISKQQLDQLKSIAEAILRLPDGIGAAL